MADKTPCIMIDATSPRTAFYKGRPVHEMTREELIDTIIEMACDHAAEMSVAYYRLRDQIENDLRGKRHA